MRKFFLIGLICLTILTLVGCSSTPSGIGLNGTTITECDCPTCKTCPPCNCPTVAEAECPDCSKCEVCESCTNLTTLMENLDVFFERYNNITGENLSFSMIYP